ncbi:MAG: hypothetical protein ACSHXK_13645 [Oceanococcus sp.]
MAADKTSQRSRILAASFRRANLKGQAVKITIYIAVTLIGLLSIAAGAAKIALVPDEVKFLAQFGFGQYLTLSFGVVQVFAGLLLVFQKTRFVGAFVAGLAFMLSSLLLLVAGKYPFSAVSLVPVVIAFAISYNSYSGRGNDGND